MIIQTIAEYAEGNPYEGGDDAALSIALDLIREHRALILNLQAITAAKLSLRTMIRALLMFSENNQFIKYDPWDPTIRIKQFLDTPQWVYQYNPFRDPANRHATGQKTTTVTGQATDFLDWETFPESEHYLIWGAPSGRQYGILVQPAPIVPGHLIIASLDENPETGLHYPQVIRPFHMEDMNALLSVLAPLGYVMGYNDKGAGASVDHFHTQAIPWKYLPIIRQMDPRLKPAGSGPVWLQVSTDHPVGFFALHANHPEALLEKKLALRALLLEDKIVFNTIGWELEGIRTEIFFPRGQEALMNNAFKAGYVEMGGMLVIPKKELFEGIAESQQGVTAVREAGLGQERFSQLAEKVSRLF